MLSFSLSLFLYYLNGGFWCTLLFSEKPCQMDHLDRILLSGIYNVRKGKTQLHKWAERLVVLCGTCLIVSSVKDCQTGKMHILPLVGGKVRPTKINYSFFVHLNLKKKKKITYAFQSFFHIFSKKPFWTLLKITSQSFCILRFKWNRLRLIYT